MDRGERLKGEETCQVRFTKWAIIEPTNMTAPSKATTHQGMGGVSSGQTPVRSVREGGKGSAKFPLRDRGCHTCQSQLHVLGRQMSGVHRAREGGKESSLERGGRAKMLALRCLEISVCVCAHAQVCARMCIHACGGLKLMLGSTLHSFETGSVIEPRAW